MSIVSGTTGAILGAQSARDAQNANQKMSRETNATNLLLDLIQRGAPLPENVGGIRIPPELRGRSASVLPYYFGNTEQGLAAGITDLFNASFGGGSTGTGTTGGGGGATLNALNPQQQATLDHVNDVIAQKRALLTPGNSFSPDAEKIRTEIRRLEGSRDAILAQRSVPSVNIAGGIPNLLRQYQEQIEPYSANFAAGDKLITDTFSGDLTDKVLAEAQPVFSARTKLANARADAGIEALQDKLNEINAIQARKGFTGDSSATNMLQFNARRKIGTDAALERAGTDLTNATEEQSIRNAGRNLMFQSLDVPYNRARQRIQLTDLPTDSASARITRTMQPFNFFKLGQGNFQVQPPPSISAIPSASQIAFTGLGRANEVAGRMLYDRYGRPTNPNTNSAGTVNNYFNNPTPGGGGGGASGDYDYSGAGAFYNGGETYGGVGDYTSGLSGLQAVEALEGL